MAMNGQGMTYPKWGVGPATPPVPDAILNAMSRACQLYPMDGEDPLCRADVGVVGGGTVGKATAAAWGSTHRVGLYDVDPDRSTCVSLAVLAAGADLLFVCVPTPAGPGGRLDADAVTAVLADLAVLDYPGLVVVRSTVPVGYTRKAHAEVRRPGGAPLRLVHSPEFLTARTADADARAPAVCMVGAASDGDRQAVADAIALHRLYLRKFPAARSVVTLSSDATEAAKLVQNTFFAVKVAFFNEAAAACRASGVPFDTLRELVLADGRVGAPHTEVPGPDGEYGFGGACLPKDAQEFAAWMTCDLGVLPRVTGAALTRNEHDRMIGRAGTGDGAA